MNLDSVIKEIWTTNIKKDYEEKYLLYEDSLKAALYYHLRRKINLSVNLRIYTEYPIASEKRADIAIVKINMDKAKTHHLYESVSSVEALIEIKYISGTSHKGFYNDLKKLFKYSQLYPKAKMYAAFIHERYYEKGELGWLDYSSLSKEEKLNITELSGWWDYETGEFVVRTT